MPEEELEQYEEQIDPITGLKIRVKMRVEVPVGQETTHEEHEEHEHEPGCPLADAPTGQQLELPFVLHEAAGDATVDQTGNVEIEQADSGKKTKTTLAALKTTDPELAKKITGQASCHFAMGRVTLASEFREDLYPEQNSAIDVGDRVYVRAAKRFGNVIRKTAETFRVEIAGKTGTFWPIELEKR